MGRQSGEAKRWFSCRITYPMVWASQRICRSTKHAGDVPPILPLEATEDVAFASFGRQILPQNIQPPSN